MKVLLRNYITLYTLIVMVLLQLQSGTANAQQPTATTQKSESGYYLSQYSGISPPQEVEPNTRRKQLRAADNNSSSQNTEVSIESDEQYKEGDVYIATGYVVITYGPSKLQADKVIYNSITGDTTAEGNVIYDPDTYQRITAQRASLNVLNRKGTFYQAMGFTDQTADGSVLNFIAERVEKTGADSYMLYGVSLTACEQATPIWQFQAQEAKLRVDKFVTVRGGTFRVKNFPAFYLPIGSLPIGRSERKSGFLIPSTGSSTQKGRFFQDAYYQTLGRSADLLLRGDLYTKRGVGFGTTFRVRTDELSSLKLGTFTVFDRIIGDDITTSAQDEGGSLFFAKGVQYLPQGFLAAVDVDFTTNLAFRRGFASDIEQVFNPEKRSQLYINKNFATTSGNYSFNFLAENKTDTLFNTRTIFDEDVVTNININIRHFPSLELTGYGQQITNLPLYLSFDATAEGLYRRDLLGKTVDFITPTLVQRFDMSPKLLFVAPDIAGWQIRPAIKLHSTYYSSSLTPNSIQPGTATDLRGVLNGRNIFRRYLDFSLDVRPPALARTFSYDDGTPRFKHIIEPFFTYRKISGVDNFANVIRFDARDAVADTNELEYGVINRFFAPELATDGSVSTHEMLSIALTQKYFFDPNFGNARQDGARNQFFPINTISGFTFGGRARRFSPLNLNVRYRPLAPVSADLRMDYDTLATKVRNVSLTGSLSKRYFSISERFYQSSNVQISPGVVEPGTFPGSLLVTNITLGNERRGYYGGTSFTYDLTNRVDTRTGLRAREGFRRSSNYFGYACDCGTIELSFSTFNVGGFRESRISFSFTLSGIGSFGTDRLQQ